MRPEPNFQSIIQLDTQFCENPSYFSDVLTPAINERLPSKNSIAGRILDHTTGIGPFFETVSSDLCDDGQMSSDSAKKAVSFITRSATSAVVVGGTATIAGLGLAVGTPFLAIGAGVVALAALPPLAEKIAFGAAGLASDLLNGIRNRRNEI